MMSKWSVGTINERIFGAMVTVGIAVVILRLLGVAREIVVAGFFGVGSAVDAFIIAMILPTVLLNSVVKSVPSAMMPLYVKERKETGSEAASNFFGGVLALSIPVFLVFSLLIAFFGGPIVTWIGKELPSESIALARNLLYWVSPVVFFTGIRVLIGGLLNAEKKFGVAAIAPSFTSIAIICGVVFYADELGAYTLGIGTVAGALLELCLLVMMCRAKKVKIALYWRGMTDLLRDVITKFWPLAFGSLLLTGNVIVDQTMAATLGPGSVSSLRFGNLVTLSIVGFGAEAIATAIFPYYSDMVANKQWRALRSTLFTYARLLALVTIPLTAVIVLFSQDIISVLFERGQFDQSDTTLVASVQLYYALQIPFHLVAILAARLILALQKNTVLMWGTTISLVVNVVLNAVFMKSMGAAGIALSTACVNAIACAYLWYMLKRLLPSAR